MSFLPRWPGRAPSLAPKFLEQSGWIFGSTINVTELNSRKDLEALRCENADEYVRLRTELLDGAHPSGNGRPQP
jgi:hypothetical protein